MNSIKDKTILITGSTDGIGKETALQLANSGGSIIIHGRNKEKCESTVNEIFNKSKNDNLNFVTADFSSKEEIKNMADEINSRFNKLDVLINNAGTYMTERVLTSGKIEMTFMVNHIAPFLLTNLLLGLIEKSAPARIINVSSVAHIRASLDFDNLQGERNFSPYGAYALSKLGNILFTIELADRLNNTGLTVNALHPGVIGTKLLYKGFGMGGADLKEGAETPVYLSASGEVENVTGKYFIKKNEEEPAPIVYDEEIRKKFWEISEELSGIKFFI